MLRNLHELPVRRSQAVSRTSTRVSLHRCPKRVSRRSPGVSTPVNLVAKPSSHSSPFQEPKAWEDHGASPKGEGACHLFYERSGLSTGAKRRADRAFG